MRKIEEQMNAAIARGIDWRGGVSSVNGGPQTEVRQCGGAAEVYLHGHNIATIYNDGTKVCNKSTLSNYPTTTTMSRLRALGFNVYRRDWQVYLDEQRV